MRAVRICAAVFALSASWVLVSGCPPPRKPVLPPERPILPLVKSALDKTDEMPEPPPADPARPYPSDPDLGEVHTGCGPSPAPRTWWRGSEMLTGYTCRPPLEQL